MKKRNRYFCATVMFIALVGLIALVNTVYNLHFQSSYEKICFDSNCIFAEVADTNAKRSHGLMSRPSLDQDQGMVFIFPKPDVYPFWMKNTLIPLDIIWINSDYEIVHIETAPPCEREPCPQYSPETKSTYVIEVNAGFAQEHDIKLGDKITIS